GLRRDDVLLAAYPKAGNTWLKFLLAHYLSDGEVGFDSVEHIVPEIGAQRDGQRVLPRGGRLIKTHEPFRTDYRRAIYLVRDARDVAISYYYHQLRQARFAGSLSDFVQHFVRAEADPYGGWQRSVSSWLDSPLQASGDMLLLRYEDVRTDPPGAMRMSLEFLGLQVDDARIDQAIRANRMERMREKEADSTVVLRPKRTDIPVVRKGLVGEWREALSPSDRQAFHSYCGPLLARLGYDANP
ncbi:MAG TPA: sulfotransferase domain-containing protein, partial [Longimicrobiales bacterium]|nr:sulfotransferase domain-containing protein [Longimicrobiales bacterium]